MNSKYIILLFLLIGSTAFAQKGIITGKVVDNQTGLPLGGSSIILVEKSISTVSDQNGVFNFDKLQAGNYTVKCSHIGYLEKIVTDITVGENENKDISISLSKAPKELKGVTLGATRVRGAGETVATLLVAQKNSANVSDGVSAETIKKTPDRSSGDVIKRVTGASIQNDKFAIIRGLNDRYNASFINGAPLPSTESDRKAFAYDIFPSGIIDNLIIYKTATPDKTAEFGGGIIEITTKSTSTKPITIISVGQGYNTMITGKKRYVSEMKGNRDWLGLDDGTRALPSGIPADKQGFINSSTEDKLGYAKLFGKYKWGVKEVETKPNLSLQVVKSLNIKIKEKQFISSLFSVSYNRSNSFVTGERNGYNGSGNINDSNYAPIHDKKYTDSVYNEEVIWSALGNIGIKIDNKNNISWKNNLSVNTDNTLVKRGGYSDYTFDTTIVLKEIFRNFVSDKIFNSQLLGEHQIGKYKTKLNWLVAYSKVDRRTPFQAISNNNQIITDVASQGRNGTMISANSQENLKSAKLDLSQPFKLFEGSNMFKMGFGYLTRERNYTNRVLGFAQAISGNPYEVDYSLLNLPYDQIFLTQNLGVLSNGKATTLVNDATVPNSAYDASSSILHAYLMNDQRYKKFRLIYGVRMESFTQKLVAAQRGLGAININYTKVDYCPSANLVYSLTEKTNIRLSYSKTLNRPEYRELANFGFPDYLSGFFVAGDSNLKRASLNNFDIRYEIFPGRAQLLSVSAFHKSIKNPIEFSTSSFYPGEAQYIQSKSATISGAEIEFRVLLSTLFNRKNEKSLLNRFTFSGNGTITKSQVTVGNALDSISSRSLQGQSPYIINVALSYVGDSSGLSSTLSLNRIGQRLAIAGSNVLPEYYDKERTVIDFQIAKTFLDNKLELKFNARDLLAQDIITYLDFDKSKNLTDKDKIFTKNKAPRIYIFSASFKF
ncbi:MAG: TonB-dependent receptor [Chitinophagaceae bacterium]|nr:TonB-dependent receptor [Chitinophagaceae bacterium]